MEGSQVIEIWHFFKVYVDKKAVEAIAEKFVDLVADLGIADEELKEALGEDKYLDSAIYNYLDLDKDVEEEDDEWDD